MEITDLTLQPNVHPMTRLVTQIPDQISTGVGIVEKRDGVGGGRTHGKDPAGPHTRDVQHLQRSMYTTTTITTADAAASIVVDDHVIVVGVVSLDLADAACKGFLIHSTFRGGFGGRPGCTSLLFGLQLSHHRWIHGAAAISLIDAAMWLFNL